MKDEFRLCVDIGIQWMLPEPHHGSLEYRQRLQAEMEVKRIEKKLEKWILDQMTELI